MKWTARFVKQNILTSNDISYPIIYKIIDKKFFFNQSKINKYLFYLWWVWFWYFSRGYSQCLCKVAIFLYTFFPAQWRNKYDYQLGINIARISSSLRLEAISRLFLPGLSFQVLFFDLFRLFFAVLVIPPLPIFWFSIPQLSLTFIQICPSWKKPTRFNSHKDHKIMD